LGYWQLNNMDDSFAAVNTATIFTAAKASKMTIAAVSQDCHCCR